MTRKTATEVVAAAKDLYEHRNEDDAFEDTAVGITISPKLSTVISVRLNPGDLATIETAAQRNGVPISTFLRQAALDLAAGPEAMIGRAEVASKLTFIAQTVQTTLEEVSRRKEATAG